MKLLYLTNIPTPYRNKRFNTLNTILKDNGVELEVLYMSESEPNRNWTIDYSSMHYGYRVWPGYHPQISNFYAHFNPSILRRLRKGDYDFIIVGGMACPTLWLAKWFVNKRAKRIISIESNLLGNTAKTGLRKFVKGLLLKGYDAYQVTGKPQEDYIEYFSGQRHKYIKLPNLIDNAIFHKLDVEKSVQEYKLVVIPARIVSYKIPSQFLDATKGLEGVRFLIVGTGEKEYVDYVKGRIASEHLPIEMLDFVQQDEMVRLYNTADYFCLPTQEDPSPLSPIEATACGLPVLLSTCAGNIDDVLVEGRNGFSFDPFNSEDMSKVFNRIKTIDADEYSRMSTESEKRYKEIFDTDNCLQAYVKQILSL